MNVIKGKNKHQNTESFRFSRDYFLIFKIFSEKIVVFLSTQGCHLAFQMARLVRLWLFLNLLQERKWFGHLFVFTTIWSILANFGYF